MIKLNPKKSKIYTLIGENDLPENERTKFHIKPPTLEEENLIKDAVYNGGPYAQFAKAFELLVTDIDYLVDDKGNKVKYEYTEEIISLIPRWMRDEVGVFALKQMDRTEEEEKN